MDQPGLPPTTNNARGSFSTLLLITFLIFMLSGGGDDLGARLEVETTMTQMRYRISNYSAWLNGTESNFNQSKLHPSFTPLAQAILPQYPKLDPSLYAYYSNISGFLSGSIVIHNLSAPLSSSGLRDDLIPLYEAVGRAVNTTDAHERTSKWTHWDSAEKTVSNVREYTVDGFDGAAFLQGNMDLTSPAYDESLKYDFEGVHLIESGQLVAMLKPSGSHIDIRRLSAYVPEAWRNATAYAVQVEMNARLERYEKLYMNGGLSDSSSTSGGSSNGGGTRSSETQTPQCSYLLFAQLRPITMSYSQMLEYEMELKEPSGARVPKPPPPKMDGVMISRECALVVELRDVGGLQTDVFWRKATTYASIAFIIYFLMLLLTVQQMSSTSSPASISKLSRWTFAIQAIIDGYAFVTHITVGIVSDNRASLSLMAPGFLAASLCLVFELRYTILMHRIQAPEDAAARASASARPPPPPPPTTTTPAASLAARRATSTPVTTAADAENDLESQQPAPATNTSTVAPTPASTSTNTNTNTNTTVQEVVEAVSNPESKTWLFASFILIILFQVLVSSSFLLPTLFSLHSYWIPQIIRNVRKGTRRALMKRYVAGMTGLRSYFLLYALACPENVLFNEPNKAVWVLFGWMLVQVGILLGQEYWGSAWFLPKRWEHKKLYEYHVPIPTSSSANDPEASAAASAELEALGDCSVCLEPIVAKQDVPGPFGGFVGNEKDKEAMGLLTSVGSGVGEKTYCLAPCNHKFHPNCLERWLSIKTICPVCRRPLPPM